VKILVAAVLLAVSTPALAQEQDPHAGHEMQSEGASQTADPHAGHNMEAEPTDQPAIGNAPPPVPPKEHAADVVWGAEPMAAARRQLEREAGSFTGSMLRVDLFEYQARHGRDGYRFESEGWLGGDINRLVIKGRGEGDRGRALDNAEGQLLYSRAIGPWFNVQAGVRHDLQPQPQRTYATIGFEGVAPYWFDIDGALFLSGKGDLLARLEASYDQRISQRLILQPRLELNFSAQDVEDISIGSGVSNLELGLRLRYEILPEVAPYVGVEWAKSFGDTARFLRMKGEDPDSINLVFGVRFWF
jgi:copper resistance protein B